MRLGISNRVEARAKAIGLRVMIKALGVWTLVAPVVADETCLSPYMPKITGQEEFIYVWTLGNEGGAMDRINW